MVRREKMVSAKGRRRRFGPKTTDEEVLKGIDLTDKTIVITGTTSGIGKETARVLATHGAHVVMLNRNKEAAQKVRDEIYSETSNRKIDLITCDLLSLKSVKAAADRFVKKGWPLHVLILNAGVASPPEHLSKDGYDSTFAVNHLAHFYLTLLLKDKFTVSPPSRVVVLSSGIHRQARIDPKLSVEQKLELLIPVPGAPQMGLTLYSRSKLCNVLFAFKLHRELSKIGVTVNAVHPGITDTGLFRSIGATVKALKAIDPCRVTKTIQQGAATSVYVGFHPDLDKISGRYFEDCWDDASKLSDLANDEKLQDALWNKSINMINEASRHF